MLTQRHRSIIDDNKRNALSSAAAVDGSEAEPEEENEALKTRDKGDRAPADKPDVGGYHDIKSSPVKPGGPPAGRRLQRTRQPFNYDAEGDCYTIEEFCVRHRISTQLYYKLRPQGLTPVEFRLGARVLISKESAAAWRRQREVATAAAD